MSSQDSNKPGNKLRRAKSLLPVPQREVREAAPRRPAPAKTVITKTATPETADNTAVKTVVKTVSKTSTSSAASDQEADLQQRIAEKAYELYQLRGYCHGLDRYDWELADQLVRLELEQEQSRSKRRFELDLDDEETKQQIAQKAYELYELKGCVQGTDAYDWHIAQEFVRLENK